MSIERWYAKGNAYADGWKTLFGVFPSLWNTSLGLSVAQHETQCGDAWQTDGLSEHNWGAVQKRKLTPAEHAAILAAGVHLLPHGSVKEALAAVAPARAALAAAGFVPDHEALHVDSNPGPGWYFCFFWAFPTDAEGAAKFVHVLAEQRASCKLLLQNQGSVAELAAAMYATHYYTGFHDPHAPGGAQANIDDYANDLRPLFETIMGALASWTSGTAPPAPVDADLCTVQGLQHALNVLGASPPLVEDGSAGPKTIAALTKAQVALNVIADGKCGPATRAAIGTALAALGLTWSAACQGLTK